MMMESEQSMMDKNEKSDMMEGEDKMTDENKMMDAQDDKMMKDSSYGTVISGSLSPFIEFNKSGYEKAIKDGKIVFLDFYANWCPICRAEAPFIETGFKNLTNESVVGFRVNFNDSETDQAEKELAKEFKVPYQHTKIFLVNGKEVERYTDQWNEEDFDKAFKKVLQ